MGYDSTNEGWNEEYGMGGIYDDHDDFYSNDSDPDGDGDYDPDYDIWDEEYDDSMDGDHDSAMESAGWGTDEDYGYYGEDY